MATQLEPQSIFEVFSNEEKPMNKPLCGLRRFMWKVLRNAVFQAYPVATGIKMVLKDPLPEGRISRAQFIMPHNQVHQLQRPIHRHFHRRVLRPFNGVRRNKRLKLVGLPVSDQFLIPTGNVIKTRHNVPFPSSAAMPARVLPALTCIRLPPDDADHHVCDQQGGAAPRVDSAFEIVGGNAGQEISGLGR